MSNRCPHMSGHQSMPRQQPSRPTFASWYCPRRCLDHVINNTLAHSPPPAGACLRESTDDRERERQLRHHLWLVGDELSETEGGGVE